MSDLKNTGIISSPLIYQKLAPSEYIDLEYLQSSGTQYINTGLTETNDTAIDCHILNENATSNYLYGARQNSGSMIYNGLYNNNSLEYNWKTISYTASSDIVMSQEIIGNNIKITLNDTTTTVSTGTSGGETIFIFACNNSSVRYYSNGFKLYYFRIKQSGQIKRNFIPVKRKSDSVLGMYDTVNNVFYTNAGSGTFIAGPEISWQNTAIKTDSVSSVNFIEY